MSKRKTPPKPSTVEKGDKLPSQEHSINPAPVPNRNFTWQRALLPLVLGAGSFFATRYFSSSPKSPELIASLPSSYGLCTEGNKIYTVDENLPQAQCMLVNEDRILAIGSIEDIRSKWDVHQNELIERFFGNEPSAKKPLPMFNAKQGSIIVPGLADAHAHLVEYGFSVQLPLDTAESIEEVLDKVEAYIKSHSEILADDTKWIQGMGWDQSRWKSWRGGFPTAEDLATRPLLANRLIELIRVDGHATWISPRALEVTKESLPGGRWPSDDEVSGGEIRKDANGNPNGIFIDNAMSLVPTPPRSAEDLEAYAKRGMTDALAVGLTSVHDASSMDEAMLDTYRTLADNDELPIRVYAMASSSVPSDESAPAVPLIQGGARGRLDIRSVKIFTDGALGSWGAALLEPYSDDPSTSGIMRLEEKELQRIMRYWWTHGWGVNVHCIGDKANKAVLDVFEGLIKNESGRTPVEVAKERRPRIEHAQIMRIEDLTRSGDLGVIASVQPTHATSDMWYAEDRLGLERIKGAYAYQTLLKASPVNVLPLGSDFPVESINPILGFYAATERLLRGSSPNGAGIPWYPKEKLTRAQALKGMTLDAAYAAFAEEEIGSLVVGKKADYVVLDRDIMDESLVQSSDILDTKVLVTAVDGKIAFGGL